MYSGGAPPRLPAPAHFKSASGFAINLLFNSILIKNSINRDAGGRLKMWRGVGRAGDPRHINGRVWGGVGAPLEHIKS